MGENNNGNGNTIKMNTAIFIWLAGLTLVIAFHAGISLTKLNYISDTTAVNEIRMKQLEVKVEAYKIVFDKAKVTFPEIETNNSSHIVNKGRK